MTDQEINEAVARGLGWNLNKTGHIGVPPHRSMGFESIPDFCHDIKAAWEVVEHLTKKGLLMELIFREDKKFFIVFGSPSPSKGAGAVQDTAPMAIAKCFLKLLEAK